MLVKKFQAPFMIAPFPLQSSNSVQPIDSLAIVDISNSPYDRFLQLRGINLHPKDKRVCLPPSCNSKAVIDPSLTVYRTPSIYVCPWPISLRHCLVVVVASSLTDVIKYVDHRRTPWRHNPLCSLAFGVF